MQSLTSGVVADYFLPQAHAYTTKRGKTKMAKMGVRKDARQNAEAALKITVPVAAPTEERFVPTAGRLGSKADRDALRARLAVELASRANHSDVSSDGVAADTLKPVLDTCGNPLCAPTAADNATSPIPSALLRCVCGLRAYCGKACQVADWPTHKGPCKISRSAGKIDNTKAAPAPAADVVADVSHVTNPGP
jgi:hypothetical protein